MPPGTKARKPRKPKLVATEPVFVPVHAASMDLPIWNALVAERGEPDLNPSEPEDEISFAEELIDRHRPEESRTIRKMAQVPAWAADTSQYLIDRAAYLEFAARMNKEKADKETDSD